jgi:Spy/CpxP family protein refolding chaperone
MRKTTSFVVAGALALAAVAGWAATSTQARIDVARGTGIDPLQITLTLSQLPTGQYADYSFVFE